MEGWSSNSVGAHPTLQNVVATVNYSTTLDLVYIAQRARNAEYSPKRFPGLVLRIREPRATGIIFKSGKAVLMGCKTEELAKLAARKFGALLKKLGQKAKFRNFKIVNLVCLIDAGFPIRLEALAADQKIFAHYSPEIFSGLIYRMVQPKCVFLIFVSGKIVVTGAKSRDDVDVAIDSIWPLLESYKKEF